MSETSTEKQERAESISSSYRQRVKALQEARETGARNDADAEVAAAEARLEAAKAKRAELDSGTVGDETETEPEPEFPKESWTKEQILDWLVENEVITEEQRPEVEGQTKAELIDNFVDVEA